MSLSKEQNLARTKKSLLDELREKYANQIELFEADVAEEILLHLVLQDWGSYKRTQKKAIEILGEDQSKKTD